MLGGTVCGTGDRIRGSHMQGTLSLYHSHTDTLSPHALIPPFPANFTVTCSSSNSRLQQNDGPLLTQDAPGIPLLSRIPLSLLPQGPSVPREHSAPACSASRRLHSTWNLTTASAVCRSHPSLDHFFLFFFFPPPCDIVCSLLCLPLLLNLSAVSLNPKSRPLAYRPIRLC